MSGYEPIDLSPFCNAAASDVSQDVALGPQSLRGLPFVVGAPDAAKALLVLGDGDDAVSIAVHRPARYVVVAHCQLSTDLFRGGPVGMPVADYVFHLSSGDRHVVEIRERFEIGVVLPMWRVLPFLAFSDSEHVMFDRSSGPWEEAGLRQTEALQGWPRWWYLWPWKNPSPDAVVERIEIVPRGPRFAVGAITTSSVDEFPINRRARSEVVVEIDDEVPGPIEVRVDRGVANYPHPLPAASAETFLADPLRGFGEAQATDWRRTYVEVAALPSATITVRSGDDEVASVRWGELEERGKVETSRARLSLRDPGRNWVHVTVLDDETGRPVPCRVHFRSPDGIPYQPHGHHHQVNSNLGTWHVDVGGDVRLGQVTYAYVDGTCQGWLPRGDVIVDVARGFEYEPLREVVQIQPGQRELTLRLRRWIDMNARGWWSGDTHVHFLSQQGAHVESQGEDLNVVNVLQSQWGALFTNTEDFTGEPSVARGGSNVVYVSQENRQHMLGHLTLLGLKRSVAPWCSDGPSEAEMGGALESTLSEWADRCHEQGGWVVLPHFPYPNGEPAALVATGRVDAVEMLIHNSFCHLEYYRYLNAGYRLPLVGGTDKMTSAVPVGLYRTYVRLAEELTYEGWCRALAAGRTFLSSGPIVHFTVDGVEVGDTLELTEPGTVEVHAWAESIFPIHTLQIVQGGRVVASVDDEGGARRLELREQLRVDAHTWLAARCAGPGYRAVPHRDAWERGIFAHTSPVYVGCGGEWSMFDEQTARYMLTLIDGSLQYVEHVAPHYEPGTVTHHHGEDDHVAWLRRPFLEARRAVEERLARYGL